MNKSGRHFDCVGAKNAPLMQHFDISCNLQRLLAPNLAQRRRHCRIGTDKRSCVRAHLAGALGAHLSLNSSDALLHSIFGSKTTHTPNGYEREKCVCGVDAKSNLNRSLWPLLGWGLHVSC